MSDPNLPHPEHPIWPPDRGHWVWFIAGIALSFLGCILGLLPGVNR